MENQKIVNLLDNKPNQPSKFKTKFLVEISHDSRGTYNPNSQIKFKTSMLKSSLCDYFFFLSGFSFTDADDSQDSRGREGIIFYYTLLLPPVHKHSDIYLQLCMWDDYHVFLIATLVFTMLLLDEIYYLIGLPFD